MSDYATPKPQTYNGNITKLPPALAHLRAEKVWLCWCWFENANGKWTKPPRRVDDPSRNASTNDPTTWGTYEQAVAQVRDGRADGIGFALKDRNIGAVDLDHCRDPVTGQIAPWADDYIRRFPGAYVEATVSGKGLRILGTSALENFAPKFKLNNGNGAAIELFSNSHHYLTLSCNTIAHCAELPPIGDKMAAIAAELGAPPKQNGMDFDAVPRVDNAPHIAPDDDVAAGGPAATTPWSYAEELRLRSALAAIPTDEKVLAEKFGHAHDVWVKIGRAIERLDWGERGYAVFRDWSAQNAKEFDEKGLRTQWGSFNRNRNAREKPTTVATIYLYAIKCGWHCDLPDMGTDDNAGALDASEKRSVVLLSSREFTANFIPPDYLVDGILQRRFFYSCTAMTGAGKTAWALYVAACVALGRPIGRHGVERGSVCYLAGENPTDVQMRWIAMAEHMDFDDKNIDVHFVVGKFKVEDIKLAVAAKAQESGREFALVFVDTSATYFPGDDENANKQAGDYARALRSLVELPGGPCVIALCHPTKNADPDNLLPRGGGAYVAEVDGNLTGKPSDTVVEIHWQGKYRGPDFDPMQFELVRPVYAARLRDSKGRPIPTVIIRHLNDAEHSQVKARMSEEEDVVLGILAQADGVSLNNIAIRAGWVENGRPVKWRAQRVTDRLRDDKLVKLTRRKGWRLTDDGKKAAKDAPKPQKPAATDLEGRPEDIL
jgi:AAA domain/Primase C terminal 2 (PriCT-2)